jgi:hypothetical protein
VENRGILETILDVDNHTAAEEAVPLDPSLKRALAPDTEASPPLQSRVTLLEPVCRTLEDRPDSAR